MFIVWYNQLGTHWAFKETVSDFESKREETIENAEYFKNYELSLSKRQYEQDMCLLQDEYEVEKKRKEKDAFWIDRYKIEWKNKSTRYSATGNWREKETSQRR